MDDVRAVMDAAGSERVARFGISERGAMSVLFASMYPERTQALVLYGSYSHFPTWVLQKDRLEASLRVVEEGWEPRATLPYFAPSKASDPKAREGWALRARRGEPLGRHLADEDERRDRRAPHCSGDPSAYPDRASRGPHESGCRGGTLCCSEHL
jgi:pimeloyl-ACP methyl ester carboxylesterase